MLCPFVFWNRSTSRRRFGDYCEVAPLVLAPTLA